MTNQAHQACTRTTQADTHTACSPTPSKPSAGVSAPPAVAPPYRPPRRRVEAGQPAAPPTPPPSPAAPCRPHLQPTMSVSPRFHGTPVISFRRVASILMAIPRPTASTTTSRARTGQEGPLIDAARLAASGGRRAHPATQGTPHSLSVGVGGSVGLPGLSTRRLAPLPPHPSVLAAGASSLALAHRWGPLPAAPLSPATEIFETILHTPADGFYLLSRHLDRLCETASSFGMCGAAAPADLEQGPLLSPP